MKKEYRESETTDVENNIAGWKGIITLGGEELPCTPENIELLMKSSPFLRNTIKKALGEKK